MSFIKEERDKLYLLSLLLLSAGLILPFFTFRENRVTGALAYRVLEMGAAPFLIQFIPLALLLYSFFIQKGKRVIRLWILPLTVLLFSILLLIWTSMQSREALGTSGRIGLTPAFFLYLLGGWVPLLPRGKDSTEPRSRKYLITALFLLVLLTAWLSGALDHLGILMEARNQQRRLVRELIHHIQLSLSATLAAVVLGLPLALWSFRSPVVKKLIFPLVDITQTIPSIALFGLMIAPLAALSRAFPTLRALGIRGIGNTPALIALSLYALFPILRYSYTALKETDPGVIESARAMGMTRRQLWRLVRLPLSLPVILHGIRVALIQTLGNATLAKLVGGNGLGVFVFEGLGQASSDMVLLGMFWIILLTLLFSRLLQWGIRWITPVALRQQYSQEEQIGT